MIFSLVCWMLIDVSIQRILNIASSSMRERFPKERSDNWLNWFAASDGLLTYVLQFLLLMRSEVELVVSLMQDQSIDLRFQQR